MREAELHFQVVALLSSTITNADQLQLLREASRHTFNHVVQKGAGQAVQALGLARVIRTLNGEHAIVEGNSEHFSERTGKFALGALYRNRCAIDGNFNASRNGDGHLTDT